MIVKDFMSYDCPVARPEHFPAEVLDLMSDFKIKQIPYVDDNEYIMLSEEIQIDELDFSRQIKEQLEPHFVNPYCLEHQHILEVLPMFGQQYLTMIPVLDSKQKYVGSLMAEDVLAALGASLSSWNEGAIITLGIGIHDYSLAQISQIVESNDAKILQLYVNKTSVVEKVEVTIKVNQKNVSGILQTFSRYNYHVESVFSSADDPNRMSERYNLLMRLLNI